MVIEIKIVIAQPHSHTKCDLYGIGGSQQDAKYIRMDVCALLAS